MAKVLQNQYYIYKIPSNKITKLKKYSFKDASRDGNIVSIGDNLVLAKIREYYGDKSDHVSLYNKVQEIRRQMKEIRKQPTSVKNLENIKKLQSQLDSMLFVDDIINIKVMAKKEYRELGRNGFDLNGRHYVRFMVGSGQMRRNTVTFINENILGYMTEKLMCGLDDKIKTINLAKLSAYFALSFSSVLWVREPRVCVIKDFNTIVPKQKVNFLKEEESGMTIHQIEKDMELNSADGQGLISPEMAKLWAEDMHLNYTPCSFVVRTAFVKGNLVPFDFKEYAKEQGITTIKDRYGTEYNINDVDVLLSESQFKMAKYYSSWEGYLSYHRSYNLKWGVARYNKEFDDEYVLTNYQYIQVLNLNKEEIDGLISYTADWIKNICSGNLEYALAYSIGVKNPTSGVDDIINSCGSLFTKAIIKNPEMLKDGFVQRKIYNSIKESIRQAKIGRIWVKGNYQFMISDPVAQCRSALGLSPDGLIPANCVYSNFWNTRTNSDEVVCCRSPLTHYSEVNPLKLFKSEETNKWYKYIYSGMIYSIYDISVMKFADSDFDGDIVFSTDNPYFIKGARREELPIIYDKQAVPTQKITLANQVRCDVRGLDTKVGQITNYSTSMIAMLPLFKNEKQKEQYEEIEKRLKILRLIQGNEIDKIKGVNPTPFPKSWKCWVNINKDDDDITKAEKYKYNSMVVKKKPYFFIYLYNTLMNDYKNYEKNFNSISLTHFGIPIKVLLRKKDHTEGEMNLLRKYRKYSPVLETECVMNILCKEIENIEFDIKYKPNCVSLLPEFTSRDNIDETKINKLAEIYKEYKAQRKYKGIETLITNEGIQDEDMNDILKNVLYANRDEYKDTMLELFTSSQELFNHLVVVCERNNWSYDCIWDIVGDDIIDIIPYGSTKVIVEDKNGFEYLGNRYRVEEVSRC
nr:MAG TPA: RNA dependent RNA polymerase [Caudoviricetes sp.]